MPDKKGRFTPMEKQFVRHYANTGDKAYAAEKAGYASPAVAGSTLAAKPAIAEEARRLALADLHEKIVPQAVKRHLALLKDEQCSGQVLIRAIDLAYKYGFAGDPDKANKQPHEMTAEELANAIAALKRAAADKAKPVIDVDPEPVPAGVFD